MSQLTEQTEKVNKNNISGSIVRVSRDLHQGDVFNTTIHKGKDDKAVLKDLDINLIEDRPLPQFIHEVTQRLYKQQFLIVGGNYSFDKNHFLCQVAQKINNDKILTKKCSYFNSLQGLSDAILELKEQSIIIIYDVIPSQIDWKFIQLKNIVNKCEHLILISSDSTYEDWNFDKNIQNTFWFKVPESSIYELNDLTQYIEQRLKGIELILPLSNEEIAKKITTLHQFDSFLEIIRQSDPLPQRAKMLEILENYFRYDSQLIAQWFSSLEEHQKILIVGLVLLEGMYENQFFEIMDQIITESWKNRNNSLNLIDYIDLIPGYKFFQIKNAIIKCRFKEPRFPIMEIAWKTHRRYFQSAIPHLTQLITASLEKNYSNWKIFGSAAMIQHLRNSIGHSFGFICSLSIESIQGELVKLAASDKYESQKFVADVLHFWKQTDHTAELKIYQMLDNWQDNIAILRLFNSNFRQTDQKEDLQPLDFIQSTVALTLTEFSLGEKSGKLSDKFLHLFSRQHNLKNRFVVRKIMNLIINTAAKHLHQIEHILLEQFLKYRYFAEPVGFGIAEFYNGGFRQKAKDIMIKWLNICKNKNSQRRHYKNCEIQDIILIAVITAIENIDYKQKGESFTIQKTYELLESLRKINHQAEVRSKLLDAIVHLMEANYTSNEQLVINFISNIDEHERELIVEKFKINYLLQREGLKGGEYKTTIRFNNHTYTFPTWIEPKDRPSTNIEALLEIWKKSKEDVLSQIALKSYVEFDRIEMKEKQLIKDNQLSEQHKKRQKEKTRSKPLDNITYDGEIKANRESMLLTKICQQFVEKSQATILRNVAIIMLQEPLNATEAYKLISRIEPTSEDQRESIYFVYSLFRNREFEHMQNPLNMNVLSKCFYYLNTFIISDKTFLNAITPFIFQTPDIKYPEIEQILNRINTRRKWWLKYTYWVCKNPLIALLSLFIFYLLLQTLF